MTQRDALHALVDNLPETHIGVAGQYLEDLKSSGDPLAWALAHVPIDDELDDDDFDGGLSEARGQVDRGEVTAHEDLQRRWAGLGP